MIRLNNGKEKTRAYENLSLNLKYLEQNTRQYNHHLDLLSLDTYKKFKELKADYDQGLISDGTYRNFIKVCKDYFDTNPAPYNEQLKAEEIKVEIKKFF